MWIVANRKGEFGKRNQSSGSGCRQSEVQTGNGDCPSSDPKREQDNGERGDNQCGGNPLEWQGQAPQRNIGETNRDCIDRCDCSASDPRGKRLEGCEETGNTGSRGETSEQRPGEFPESRTFPDWSRDWREVAALTCVHRMDDGLPRRLVRFPDGSTISESKWRQEALKAYGNSIVPQVAMEIMRAIKEIDP